MNGNENSKCRTLSIIISLTKTVAITGPESTGKSILAQQLADHYRTVWVPEYAREYLEKLNRPYEEEDILNIARGQLAAEIGRKPQGKSILFCDTDAIVTKIWSVVKYGRCHAEILRMIDEHPYDLYLLCDIDLPWTYDPLREHPHYRKELFGLYFRELTERKLPFRVISGFGELRLKHALEAITGYF